MNLCGINHSIAISKKQYPSILILALIHALFLKGIISDIEITSKREKTCGETLSKFDSYFNFKNVKGEKRRYFYHIKNAVSHGGLIVNHGDIVVCNIHKKTI